MRRTLMFGDRFIKKIYHLILNFMPIQNPSDNMIGFQVKKKLRASTMLAEYLLGVSEIGLPVDTFGVYQSRQKRWGHPIVRMRSYYPTNPRTVAQQANRQKFTDGMVDYMALTDEQKQAYNKRAKPMGLHGRNLYLREYLRGEL